MTHSHEGAENGELDLQAQKVDSMAREVLGANYVYIRTKHLELSENFAEGSAYVKAQVFMSNGETENTMEIEGRGVGLVDAFFDGMLKNFAREHASLPSISIVDFNINIKLRGSHGRRSDALAIALLRVKNSDDHEYAFSHRTPSVSQSSVAVVQDAIGFFVNCERAYVQLYVALEDAKHRARPDLVQRYQNQMATLVQATSYREVVQRIASSKASAKNDQ